MRNSKCPPIDGPNVGYATRFRQALKFAKLLGYDDETGEKLFGSYAKVAKELGVTAPYIGDLYRGIQMPSGKMGVEIARKLGVTSSWLNDEEGPMVAGSVVSLEKLSDDDQAVVRSLIKSLEAKGEKQ